MPLTVRGFTQSFPLAQEFRIARGAKYSAEVFVVVVSDGEHFGWGEAVPYQRYGESLDTVSRQIWLVEREINGIEDHHRLPELLPPGSARNALDCALWDLRAKRQNQAVHELLKLPPPSSCISAQTLSIGSKDAMQQAAEEIKHLPMIKVKLDGDQVVSKMRLLHATCPDSQFIVDANESWSIDLLEQVLEPLSQCNVALIEQPLSSDDDQALSRLHSPIPLCADESCHTADDLPELANRYQVINIKLDKSGGLTEAVKMVEQARNLDLSIMLGCMVGTSLAMAPAYLLNHHAQFVDLDGPLLVAEDREQGFEFRQGSMSGGTLWGVPIQSNRPDLARALMAG